MPFLGVLFLAKLRDHYQIFAELWVLLQTKIVKRIEIAGIFLNWSDYGPDMHQVHGKMAPSFSNNLRNCGSQFSGKVASH